MDPSERREEIKNILAVDDQAEVKELAEKFDVSAMTIRRDLNKLEDDNLIIRTRGGAIRKNIINDEVPFNTKKIKYKKLKDQISKKAEELIKPNETIFLDAGTTTFSLAKRLKCMRATIITNDIFIMLELHKCPSIELICVGGKIQNKVGSILGNEAVEFINSVYVDIGFIGAHSISYKNLNLSTPTLEKVALKNEIISSANKSVLLADNSKLGRKSPYKICQLSKFDVFVSDDEIKDETLQHIKSNTDNLKIL